MADKKDDTFIKVLKFIGFIPLTVLVVPAMLIMVWAHPTWEKWLNDF